MYFCVESLRMYFCAESFSIVLLNQSALNHSEGCWIRSRISRRLQLCCETETAPAAFASCDSAAAVACGSSACWSGRGKSRRESCCCMCNILCGLNSPWLWILQQLRQNQWNCQNNSSTSHNRGTMQASRWLGLDKSGFNGEAMESNGGCLVSVLLGEQLLLPSIACMEDCIAFRIPMVKDAEHSLHGRTWEFWDGVKTATGSHQQSASAHSQSPSQLLEFEAKVDAALLRKKDIGSGKDPVLAGMAQKIIPKFSSFFKKITIYLDASLYPDNHVILWESARSPALHEGLELKRKGDKESTIQAAIWHYVKSKKLQNYEDNSFFSCDPSLQKKWKPIHLEHRIKLSGNCPIGSSCYDVQVDVPFPLEMEKSAFMADMEKNKEIDTCNEVICTAIKKIHEHCRRQAFFLGFSQSSAEFINALISSQGKDLKLFAGEANHNAEKDWRSEFYNQPWIKDAVIHYLNRKSMGGDSLGST
ncbi:SWIB/MDM2 domain superfamily protein isoform 2 [Hibiscus syriacus]|uniref:SWIB/MDM2 domain superfamily protein isoform 2 n=1 Tax=Hibiscus syriacus TaxID=106335 RepID=A0A6A2X539_HIBSY|nr:SWIB/MDM2 domain superfamily protein isoform 2 [Hibiscus syriacus]